MRPLTLPPAVLEWNMRIIVSLLVSLGLAFAMYLVYLKSASSAAGGGNATQAISTTAVQMQLLSIAQAERIYYTQNGSYATLDQLASDGVFKLNTNSRDGYAYSVQPSADGFVASATHPDDVPPAGTLGSTIHYPTLSIDQSMQVHHTD